MLDFVPLAPLPGDLPQGGSSRAARGGISEARVSCAHGKRLLHLGQPADALPLFDQSIEIDPENAEPYVLKSVAYILLGRLERAVDACKQALRLRPIDAYASFYLGFAYDKLGRKNDALEAYRYARQFNISDPQACVIIGAAFAEIGRASC